jgi:thiamine biosynthesis lipoprotein
MEVGGRRYCHLLDARTGWPVDCAQLASVAAPLCLVAGSVSSCALLAGPEGLAQLSEWPHLWVDQGGSVHGSLAR